MNLTASILTEVRRICRACPHSVRSGSSPLACAARHDRAPILDNPVVVAGFCPWKKHDAVLPPPEPGQPQESLASRLRRGMVGITKAVMGVDPAPPEAAKARLSTCEACDRLKHGVLGRYCNECGCYVELKVKVAGERCPIGKWSAVEAAKGSSGCGGCGGPAAG